MLPPPAISPKSSASPSVEMVTYSQFFVRGVYGLRPPIDTCLVGELTDTAFQTTCSASPKSTVLPVVEIVIY